MTALFPTFNNRLMTSSRLHKEIENKILRASWIIPQLFDELNEAVPSSYEATPRTDSFHKQQRLTEFTEKCNDLFPVGRKFAKLSST